MLRRTIVPILLAASFLLTSGAAFAQQNTGFEAPTESEAGQPAYWNTGGEGYQVTLTDEVAYEGSRSLRMQRTTSGRFGVATQALPADSLTGERLRLSGYIKTQAVEEGYAGLWVRVDGSEGALSFDNMRGRGATGTTPWTRYEVEVSIPQKAERILFGALMPGSGTAWFDALKLEGLRSEDLPPPSDEARAYLNRALDLMEERSINRDSIDWPALREATTRRARGAETTADTYPALRYAIDRLGDNHSFLRPPRPRTQRRDSNSVAKEKKAANWEGPSPRGTLLSEEIGYVRIPGFIGGGVAGIAFADSLQHVIAGLDREGVCRWIIDLRENTGGNMWPMLSGVGPLLGEGKAGMFVYPDDKEVNWWYRDGKSGSGENVLGEVSEEPYELSQPYAPVAVLTGPRTSSSGEAIVVSFRERPRTRSFGQSTSGLSTANESIPLSDGAMLLLTTSTFADRTGTIYGGRIEPDVTVEPGNHSSSLSEDPVVEAARSWIEKQTRCTSTP